MLGARREADAPPRHGVGLRDPVADQNSVLQTRLDAGEGRESVVLVEDVLVDVVREDRDVGMPEQHLSEGSELGGGVATAGGVSKRVQDQPLGSRGDNRLKRGGADLEGDILATGHRDRRAAGKPHHVGVGHPVGGRDDDLVALVEGGEEGVGDDLLTAGPDTDLGGLVVQAVVALEFADDGLLELRGAVDIGVACGARVDGGLGRRPDVLGRVEVRLALRQADDVPAGPPELVGELGDGDGRRGLHGPQARGQFRSILQTVH